MMISCHEEGEPCWFADVDDLGCQGRFAVYVMAEAGVRFGAAVPA
ncbi:hypothetical protein ACFXJ8_02075 [Nonomuraea sp. NPDC059194]